MSGADNPRSHFAEPRSAELTRPLRLGRIAIIAGLTITAALVATLSFGVGRSTLGFAPPMAPGRIEVRAQNPGGTAAFAFRRQIAMTRDGAGVVFVMETSEGENVLATQSLDSQTPVLGDEGDSITDNRSAGTREIEAKAESSMAERPVELRYAAGHVVYVQHDGSLMAAPFDRKTNRMTAKPVKIGSSVAITPNGIAQFAVSKNGNVAYLPEGPRSLVLVTPDGKLHNATNEHGLFSSPRFSPDGKTISVDISNEDGRDVWTVSVDGGALKRATFMRDAHDAAWTPDGKFITYTSYRLGALGIYRSKPGVDAKPDSVFTAQPLAYSGDWLKDGTGIVTVASNLSRQSGLDIALISDSGRGPVVPVLANQSETRSPAVSPDGQWLAYVSNVSGRDEVYVRPWNRDGTPWRISADGATEPVWNPDGSKLFYRETPTQFLMSASLLLSPNRVLVPVRQGLFPIGEMIPGFTHSNFDISPDGQTLVMVMRSPPSSVKVLTNVPEILRRANSHRGVN
jgi:Tol biopolymer transport system component